METQKDDLKIQEYADFILQLSRQLIEKDDEIEELKFELEYERKYKHR